MSRRESKGQRVKTFKHFIPQPDLTTTEHQVAVFFQASDGRFAIYDGSHMLDACKEEMETRGREIAFHRDHISATTLAAVLQGFEDISRAYTRLLRDQKKKRVIRFNFQRNIAWAPGREAVKDIGFCPAPALHFHYELLWQVGDKLYRQDRPDATLQYRCTADNRDDGDVHLLDWTEERESFFKGMHDSLVELIQRVEKFQDDLARNVDLVIEGKAPALLLAPPPKGDAE